MAMATLEDDTMRTFNQVPEPAAAGESLLDRRSPQDRQWQAPEKRNHFTFPGAGHNSFILIRRPDALVPGVLDLQRGPHCRG